jgi:hypothetical protein
LLVGAPLALVGKREWLPDLVGAQRDQEGKLDVQVQQQKELEKWNQFFIRE